MASSISTARSRSIPIQSIQSTTGSLLFDSASLPASGTTTSLSYSDGAGILKVDFGVGGGSIMINGGLMSFAITSLSPEPGSALLLILVGGKCRRQ